MVRIMLYVSDTSVFDYIHYVMVWLLRFACLSLNGKEINLQFNTFMRKLAEINYEYIHLCV